MHTVSSRRPASAIIAGLASAVILALGTATAQARGGLPAAVSDADFPVHSDEQVELGKLLFHDKLLSGNRNISCATCHHVLTSTGDGLALPLGESGFGLGISRDPGESPASGGDGVHERVPRNAPAVFNLGAAHFHNMFWDGRISTDAAEPSGFVTPAGADTPVGLDSPLAAQALFPITSHAEMAGHPGDNPIANAPDARGVWDLVEARLQDPANGYVALFQAAYPAAGAPSPGPVAAAGDITIVHYANAVAAYEATAFRATNSPFDRYLRGDRRAMSRSARAGMRLFYGRAGCSDCHSGPFQTDLDFHAIGMPQIGPGRGDTAPDGAVNDDFGREQVTGDPADRYKFRTPTLRNTALTGPWGHAGAYNDLEAMVRHELDRVNGLQNYDTSQAALPPRADLDALDFANYNSAANRAAIEAAIEDPAPVNLNDRQVGYLIDFLHALTDPDSVDLRAEAPFTVPSGDTVAD